MVLLPQPLKEIMGRSMLIECKIVEYLCDALKFLIPTPAVTLDFIFAAAWNYFISISSSSSNYI